MKWTRRLREARHTEMAGRHPAANRLAMEDYVPDVDVVLTYDGLYQRMPCRVESPIFGVFVAYVPHVKVEGVVEVVSLHVDGMPLQASIKLVLDPS